MKDFEKRLEITIELFQEAIELYQLQNLEDCYQLLASVEHRVRVLKDLLKGDIDGFK